MKPHSQVYLEILSYFMYCFDESTPYTNFTFYGKKVRVAGIFLPRYQIRELNREETCKSDVKFVICTSSGATAIAYR